MKDTNSQITWWLILTVCKILSALPVWYNSLQGSYEVGHHHIDALQVSTEERGRVQNNRRQNWSTDEIGDLEPLNQDHVEPEEREIIIVWHSLKSE